MNNIEIEKTYLARDIPIDFFKGKSIEIIDLYIGDNIRIRKKGDKLELTKKIILNGQLEREELNIPLDEDEFELLSKSTTQKLSKKRFYHDFSGITLEIDVWEGEFKGITTVEAEFKSSDEASKFNPPKWCFRDVTEDSHGSLYKCLKVWRKYYSLIN